MNKKWFFAMKPGILAVMAIVFILVLFLIKVLWAWTIPDIFPGAVDQGLIVAELSWLSSLKIAIFVAVVFGLAKGKISQNNR